MSLFFFSFFVLFLQVFSRRSLPRSYSSSHFLKITVSATTCNVLDYGAKGDGKTDDTKAVQSALDDCREESDGGTVYFPSGYNFLLFPISISSAKGNLSIHIESNCTLTVNNDMSGYSDGTHWFEIHSASNMVISGGGNINGQGQVWWDAYNKDNSVFRPHLFYTSSTVNNLLISNLHLYNAPQFFFSLSSSNTEVSNLNINAPADSPNTDGVDPSGNNNYIHNCYISTGDDNVAIKNGNNTLVENCNFGTGHGASIGSLDGDQWMTNLTFRNIEFYNTTNGARIKGKPGSKQGRVWDIIWENLGMKYVKNTIVFTQYYQSSTTEQSYLFFNNMLFKNITSTDSTNAGTFDCQPSTPCTNITLDDVSIKASKQQFECQNIQGTCNNVSPNCCFQSTL